MMRYHHHQLRGLYCSRQNPQPPCSNHVTHTSYVLSAGTMSHRHYITAKAPPATQNVSQKSSGGEGGKNKKNVRRVTNLNFGQLILSKIIKIVATRSHILRLKRTIFDFVWGSAPDHTGGAHSAPLKPPSWI